MIEHYSSPEIAANCESRARIQGIIDENGKLNTSDMESASRLVRGARLVDDRVEIALWPPGSGLDEDDWEKAGTEIKYFTKPFRFHFYRRVDASDSSSYGVKVVFEEFFTP